MRPPHSGSSVGARGRLSAAEHLARARGSLLLVRHGETEWTRARRVTGRQPVALSDAGREQAHGIVPLLRALAPDRVVTSPLARARETAEMVSAALGAPLTVEPDLVELDFGAWEGRAYDDLLDDPAYLAFSRDPVSVSPPGGEAVLAAQRRAVDAVARVLAAAAGARVCAVSHGDVIRMVLAAALRLDVREFRALRVDTCGVSAIELTGDWAEVKFVNLVADPARVWTPLHFGRGGAPVAEDH